MPKICIIKNMKLFMQIHNPPWKYRQGKSMGINFQGAADAQYNCMNYKDICNLPVNKFTEKDCILFIWVTFPQIIEGLEVIKAWGFTYKTIAFNWVKLNKNNGKPFFGIGYYTKSNSEVCLLATKGNPHKFVKDNTISQIIMSTKTKHSKKPDEARNKIVQLVGDRPRIELFAREKTEGWDTWGDEVKSDIIL